MGAKKETVYVVADESPAAEGLSTLLRAKGKVVRLFGSIRDFLDFSRDDSCACLIVSLKALGTRKEALELISHTSIPVIFITGRSDIPSAVSAKLKLQRGWKPVRSSSSFSATGAARDKDIISAIRLWPSRPGSCSGLA
jgi:FixJ family two-component response regulator